MTKREEILQSIGNNSEPLVYSHNQVMIAMSEYTKELVEGLEWIEEKTRLDCYTDVDVAEINERAATAIQKHKQ